MFTMLQFSMHSCLSVEWGRVDVNAEASNWVRKKSVAQQLTTYGLNVVCCKKYKYLWLFFVQYNSIT